MYNTSIISSAFAKPTRRGSRCVPKRQCKFYIENTKEKENNKKISHETCTVTHGLTSFLFNIYAWPN